MTPEIFEPIQPVQAITPPLALRESGDPERFSGRAESNLKDMAQLADDLNEDFIPKINAVGAIVNTIIPHLDAINDAPAQADAAAQSAGNAANSATAAQSAQTVCEEIQETLTEGATVEPTPNAPMKRDADGRSQAEAPVDGKDVANRAWVEGAILSGGTPLPTPSTGMARDASGRSQVEAPVEDKDVANKEWVLSVNADWPEHTWEDLPALPYVRMGTDRTGR
jgi:hypothetical protein